MIGRQIAHYRIERELGRGGMGIVYLARDTKLERLVALKFLSPVLTREPTAHTRFVNEAKAAAALNHPNISTIYEIGQAEDQTFIAMEYVSGPSLQEKLTAGPLSVDAAVAITVQIARGLGRAHSQGIVHRDIKPGNILLTAEGDVKIVDFGLAVLSGQGRITVAGATVGTAAYMSPEQALGNEVTHQTDLWSLGVLHYEMLTGSLPFAGDYAQAQIYAILNSEPEPLAVVAPSVPAVQDAVLARALAKDPAERFANARDFADALLGESAVDLPTGTVRPVRSGWRLGRLGGRLAAALAVLVVVLSLAYILRDRSGLGDFAPRDWLLITEFKDLSPAGDLQSALREALVIDMQQSRHVNVFVGRRLSDALARMGKPPQTPITEELGGELAVRESIPAVLTGSVSRLGETYLITAQLIDPVTGSALLAKRVEAAEQSELLGALDELSRAVRERLGESLGSISSRDEPLDAVTTPSLEALRLYSRGNQALLASDWNAALDLLTGAVAADSTFAMAYAKLARIHFFNANTADALTFSARAWRWRERLTPRERQDIEVGYHRYRAEYGEAIRILEAQLAEYPDDLETRIALATTYQLTMRYADALREVNELDQDFHETWYYLQTMGNNYAGMGAFPAAVDFFRRAVALNPGQLRSRMCLSAGLLCMGEFAAAEAELDSLLACDVASAICGDYLVAKVTPALGQFKRTLASLQTARQTVLTGANRNQLAWVHIYAGYCHARRSDYARAQEAFASATEIWPGDHPLLYLGKTQVRRGDLDGAERTLDRLAALCVAEPTRSHEQFLLKLEGAVARGLGDLALATNKLEQCLPDYLFNLDARFSLGQAYLADGQFVAAREQFEFIVQNRYSTFIEGLFFLWPLAHYHLGLVALAQGDTDQAHEQLTVFLTVWADADDGLTEVADARQKLASLASPDHNGLGSIGSD